MAAALKKIKRHKAPGLSRLLAELIQATWDIGIQWLTGLCAVVSQRRDVFQRTGNQ